jgi:hypothetical protein
MTTENNTFNSYYLLTKEFADKIMNNVDVYELILLETILETLKIANSDNEQITPAIQYFMECAQPRDPKHRITFS